MAEVVVIGQQRAQRRIDADLERRVVHSDRDQPPVVIPHPIRPRAAARQQQCRQGDRQNDWPPAAWTARSVIAVMRYSARNAIERQFLDSFHNPLAPLGVHTMIRAGGLCARTGMGVDDGVWGRSVADSLVVRDRAQTPGKAAKEDGMGLFDRFRKPKNTGQVSMDGAVDARSAGASTWRGRAIWWG